MARKVHRLSIFSQTLDRVAFIAYFLGAVIPLACLALAAQQYVIPAMEASAAGAKGLVTGLVGVAVLSLGSFLTLRRVTRQTLQRMNADNHRLETLLEVSGALSEAPHTDALLGVVARCAQKLTEAHAAFVVRFKDAESAPELAASGGADAATLYETLRTPVDALAKLCASRGRPALVNDDPDNPSSSHAGLASAAAVPLRNETDVIGAVVVVHIDRGRSFDTAEAGALSTLAGLSSVAVHKVDLQEAQKNFFAHMTDILVTALDAQLDLQSGHSRRVAHFATVMGREMGLDEKGLEKLHFAALLHDVGMLKIDSNLRENKKACQKHPQLGHRMLVRIRLWEEVAPIVLHHHEWWNGEGYPEGLTGEDIPLESRIIGIAEAFDSMTSPSGYRMPVPISEALEEVRRCSGTQFDPDCARVFLDLVDRDVIHLEQDS
ncbi:MAG: HD domain-containing protein [Deltaproteobacteria bacterium]|nr:MAG: HD domain-containing protein [Deltaproteobacteria bacterium]